ncbi:TDP-N-acetylfucosamine:lipid II N-acetylfucosaminyltransferase [Serratia fonticola]|uniref:TDP-N-acetylfucosamine:lipid II N-acetylfucosaminyltransferase n=1 Tax=Serratia fonticola TaxID=47917 RepID=UPI002177103C|nr:TDP-N-acetylfucosamine:lipid II N-acetylfucosaminyltransferase [Serratia fonticola]CAI1664860.1 4-alpha-L-fucosyltransferase [Serratia fonticola]
MKIVHVCSIDKFIPPFIKYIDDNFNSSEHIYWIFGEDSRYNLEHSANVKLLGSGKANKIKNTMLLIKDINNSDKVILHSFLGTNLAILLFLLPWVLKKCYWFVWGADLYCYKTKRNIKWYFREFFRKPVIKRIGHLVTYIKGDYLLAKKWYGCTGQYVECLLYSSNVFKHMDLQRKNESDGVQILLGNSADPANNHFRAFEKIERFKSENIKVFVPLSYGDQIYAEKVISEGKRIFGDKFIPLTEFMPFQKYLDLLATIDIAIFNHDRQQAMGNTISLLGLGKTIFINSNTTQWELLKDKEIHVLDIKDFTLTFISEEMRNENVRKIKEYFSNETLAKQLRSIFK